MSAYNEWLDKQSESRGLSPRRAFEGGQREMLEKVLPVLKDADHMIEDMMMTGEVNEYILGIVRRRVKTVLDQLAKEIEHE